MAFSISVHHGHEIFKNSLFSFVIYPITVSLTLFLHPFPYHLPRLPYPYPAFPVGQGPGRLMKIWRGSESSLHVPTKKMTVTKIERDQSHMVAAPMAVTLAILTAIPVFIIDNSAKNYVPVRSRLSKFLAKFHCCKHCRVHQLTPSCTNQ